MRPLSLATAGVLLLAAVASPTYGQPANPP